MRTTITKRLMGLTIGTLTAGALAFTGAPAQAAALVCPINGGTVTYCKIVPGKKAMIMTATTVNASPEPAERGHMITVSGQVRKLLSGGNGNNAGTARIYFVKAGTTASAYMGTATVNSSGHFSKKFTAKYSGSWWARYSGNASTTTTNGRVGSNSGRDFVQVQTTGTKTVVVGQTPRLMTDWTTSYRQMNPSKDVRVALHFRCDSLADPNLGGALSFRISTVGGNNGGTTDSVEISSNTTVFDRVVYLDVDDVATAIKVENLNPGVACSVALSGTQQRITIY